ncbi:MAG: hypothetical protein SFV51_19810 [Bryobacteraceae bacterium]|nr:hypothetical protein [Bryobacteraceae bacterium]
MLSRRGLLLGGIFRPSPAVYMGIPFHVLRNGRSRRRYLHIHGDESTAREVLREHMKTHRGIAHLVDSNERTVPAGGGKLDPNRMFSREGAQKNLRLLNPAWSDAQIVPLLDRLDRERGRLLGALLPPSGGLLVALHNNARGYSVNSELEISDEKALNDAANPHEFFLVTDPADFRVLAASPFNALLQKRGPNEDDGSLSRLAAKRGVRYLNLECALGKAARQKEMLNWMESRLA